MEAKKADDQTGIFGHMVRVDGFHPTAASVKLTSNDRVRQTCRQSISMVPLPRG